MASNNVSSALSQLIERALARSGMTYATFLRCITQNAFRTLIVWSESDLERLLLVSEALGLSPTGRDLYAVQPEGRGACALLAVSVDGWVRIVNQHPQFDGMEFEESAEHEGGVPAWISCTIYRKDRRAALSIKEYLCETFRDTSAWQTHPRRMLRHKALVQCARLAFELPTSSGVYDIDEAERIAHAQQAQSESSTATHLRQGLRQPGRQHLASSESKQASEEKIAEEVKEVSPAPSRGAEDYKSYQAPYPKKRRGPSSTQELIGALTR
jgi:hypothetical protein